MAYDDQVTSRNEVLHIVRKTTNLQPHAPASYRPGQLVKTLAQETNPKLELGVCRPTQDEPKPKNQPLFQLNQSTEKKAIDNKRSNAEQIGSTKKKQAIEPVVQIRYRK